MAHPNEDLVRQGYDAFSSGDMDTLGKLMTPDVVHSVPGESLISGEHKGQDEVFAMYGQLFELSNGTMQVELLEVTAKGDDKVVAKHRSTAKRGDKTIDDVETLEFSVVDGKITRLEESFGDQAAQDAFWS
jgi:ketosteroid isomerase-like protein